MYNNTNLNFRETVPLTLNFIKNFCLFLEFINFLRQNNLLWWLQTLKGFIYEDPDPGEKVRTRLDPDPDPQHSYGVTIHTYVNTENPVNEDLT